MISWNRKSFPIIVYSDINIFWKNRRALKNVRGGYYSLIICLSGIFFIVRLLEPKEETRAQKYEIPHNF